jgi:hypothetical protein
MTFFPDLCESTMVSTGKHVRAIGWLSKEHVYTTGSTTDEFASRLAKICQNWTSCPEELGFGMFMGWHTCEFCGRFRADGNIGIPAGDLLYIAPEMIHHYVTAHQYSPPSEFIDAIMACPVPGTPEYARLCRPFRDLQDAYVNERWNRMVTQAAIWARDNGGESVFPQAALRFLSSSCAEYAEQVRTAFEALTKKDG